MKETNEKLNYNYSGFDEDSLVSSLNETKRKTNGVSRFLIKSHMTDSFNNNINKNNTDSFNNISKKGSENIISNNKNNNNENFGNIDDNNIISTNSLTNLKNSINSDEQNLKKIKKENDNEDNNELNTNLINQEEDNIIFNFKNKLSKLSTPDDILRDTIKIPMNHSNKFKTSRLARTFIYEENGNNKQYYIRSKKFGISKGKNIVTYILNLYIFSEFINYDNLEKDSRFKLFFVHKDISQEKFSTSNNSIQNILTKLNMDKNKGEQIISFINGINKLLNDKEYKDIHYKNKKYKICLYIVLIILLLLISGISYSFYFFFHFIFEQNNLIKYSIIISAGIIFIICIIFFILQIIKIYNKNIYIKYNFINYMLINYTRYNDYIEEWNKNFFENKKIRISIPISFNYIMFNLDPYQVIEIKHLDTKWFIEKVYNDQKSMINDKEFIKYFIKVRSTLLVDNNNNTIYE